MKKWFILCCTFLLCNTIFAQNWYQDDIWQQDNRPYLYYPVDQQKKQIEQMQKSVKPSEIEAFESLQVQLDQSRKIAIMNPTPENIKNYVALQELAMTQAATFTEQWQRVLWENPSLDYSLKGRPTNTTAVRQYDQQRGIDTVNAIKQIAGSNGVMFFYRSDCPYCHAMAPVLRNFANQYGVEVMAVSLDGGPIEGFPDAQVDNGIATKLQVSVVPALFIMDTKTKSFKPISHGVISQSELESRFLAVSKEVGTLY
ncbi:conjugal transfer protein TraF [Neisseria sp. Ec49-e6-T10]|uniref:conjugal transfer protein TraF n=1 Tax=Neisseria sp. Ec49-e6-T10 TaxID=3140744 RepID=UPI003EB8C174